MCCAFKVSLYNMVISTKDTSAMSSTLLKSSVSETCILNTLPFHLEFVLTDIFVVFALFHRVTHPN